jgi:hypothetical protein
VNASAILRRAAAGLRERAEGCGAFGRARWRYEESTVDWPLAGQLRTDDDDPHGLIADFWPSAQCGPYVAAMHPAVALAVADLLDVAARTADLVQGLDGSFPPLTAAALAMARAYLGASAGEATGREAA